MGAVGAVLVLAFSGCGGGGAKGADVAPSATAPVAGSDCPDLAAKGKPVRFSDPDRTSLAGIELGSGATGVVMAHQDQSNSCEWLPFGIQLAGRGYHVLAFDFAGEGASEAHRGNDNLDDDVLSAAGYLKAHGVTTIVLMGASKGGTASLAAAVRLKPAPAAVITLSAPTDFDGVDAATAVTKLTSPALFLAAQDDEPFADAAQQFDRTVPKTTEHTVFLGIGGEHGTALFESASSAQVYAAINKILAAHAPAA